MKTRNGVLAHLVERFHGMEEVRSSNLLHSTTSPFFEGPVFISRRNKTVGVILSIDEYNKLLLAKPKRTILEAAAEFRKNVDDTLTDEEIDRIFNNRDSLADIDDYESDVFDGVFD